MSAPERDLIQNFLFCLSSSPYQQLSINYFISICFVTILEKLFYLNLRADSYRVLTLCVIIGCILYVWQRKQTVQNLT